MFVRYRDVMYKSSCQVLSNTRMECRSPSVVTAGVQIPPEEPLQLEYGFLMDSVPSVQNLSRLPGFTPFLLYPDPVYEKFDEEVKYYKSDYLTINGNNLDRACQVLPFTFSTLRVSRRLLFAGIGRRGDDRNRPLQRYLTVSQPADVQTSRSPTHRFRTEAGRRPRSDCHRGQAFELHNRKAELRRAQQRRRPAPKVSHHRCYHW